ncbi:phosphatase PAP2 family protein [Blastococcus haudaquaticus]|uniref:PAP2 superfamily protein n=1 Tax=Blastococcus haudaquaticus TaxID=1938745 RepID=A0A286GGD2_9ACTN|nr:phosphatase PAP2 family protein [Blastococcus haudaquaticus]SOD94550.1 PAP2 superfamily protein [Blastococcus haudaquaticus]
MTEPAVRVVRSGAYGMAVAVALVSGIVAIGCAVYLGLPLRDPDGFLGPTYVRLPLIVTLMLAADVLPRALWRTRSATGLVQQVVVVARERWPWRRLLPVLIGLAAFYATYVSYRNLKHFLPLLRSDIVDDELAESDGWFTGDTAPAEFLHDVLGTGAAAHILSWVYLAFLMFVPASLALALVSRARSHEACWYVTALCLNWSLGTASYYLLPSRGPVYAQPELFWDLPQTGTSALQHSLLVSRWLVLEDPQGTDRIQSIAAFASLHVSIIFTAALIAQLTLRSVAVRAVLWAFFALTVTATIYFGWHYIVDDIAGLAIGGGSVLLAAWGTGRFRRPVAAAQDQDAAGADRPDPDPVPDRLRRRPETSPSAP